MPNDSSDLHAIDSHKLHLHPDRVAAWARARTIEEKLAIPPIYVEISPVGQCNHRCTFCAVDYIGYINRKIDYTVLREAISNMKKLGVKSIMFAGEGEPMLHSYIGSLTRIAKLSGIDTAFTTNGTCLNKKFVDEDLSYVTWIKVSMNGGAKTYAQIHRTKEADYERVWSNLAYACEQRTKNSWRCSIGIQCVCLPENIGCLEELACRASSTGIDYLVLKPYSQHTFSTTTKYSALRYGDQSRVIFNKLRETYTGTFKVIVRENGIAEWNKHEHPYTKCNATPYFWAYIMATGDVYSCSAYLLDPKFCLGNINEQSFSDIWHGEKRRQHIIDMESLDISKCRLNCRMNQVNKYLWQLEHPDEHVNFI